MRCLITGATGNIGSLVTERLIARGERPRVFVRDHAKARASFGTHVDIHVGDLADERAALLPSLLDMDAVFLVNSGPDLDVRDREVALAARAAGVRRVVKLSTLDVRTGIGTGPWHARGEAAIRESGVAFTFIQAAGFMLNALSWAPAIKREGVLRSSTGDGKIAFIHEADIADVAVAALTTNAYERASLVITGPEALSYAEMASLIGDARGKPVRFETISDERAHRGLLARGADRPFADALVDIWGAVRDGRLATVSDGVERVLGRRALPFQRWAEENARAFR